MLAPPGRVGAGLALSVECVAALQRTAGNQAVCRYIQQARGGAPYRDAAPRLGRGLEPYRAVGRSVLETDPATATAPGAAVEVGFVREEGLNLREQADQKSGSLAQLKFGTRVRILQDEMQHPGWHKVAAQAGAGFVYAPHIHFAPPALIQKDPALKLIRVAGGQTFWGLVKEQYGIRGDEGDKDQNINHFINAIRAVNKPEAFNVETDLLDDFGNVMISGRDATDTLLKEGVDLWIPSFAIAASMDVGSGTIRGELSRIIKKVEQKIADFKAACAASGKYIPGAIARHAGEVSAGLLKGLIDFALDAAAILAASTAAGALIGALFGGVGAAPGAAIGFEVGLLILEIYGLTMLIEAILSMAGNLMSQLGSFISQVWEANGDKKQLEAAGKTLADALGILVSAVLMALVAYLMKKGAKAVSQTKFAKTVGQSELAKWLAQRQAGTSTREALKPKPNGGTGTGSAPKQLPAGKEPPAKAPKNRSKPVADTTPVGGEGHPRFVEGPVKGPGNKRNTIDTASPALKKQINAVLEAFEKTGQPPPGVRQGGRPGQPGVFQNAEGKLPPQPPGHYTESDIWPGTGPRGAERIVRGKNGEAWYSPDHYGTFRKIK